MHFTGRYTTLLIIRSLARTAGTFNCETEYAPGKTKSELFSLDPKISPAAAAAIKLGVPAFRAKVEADALNFPEGRNRAQKIVNCLRHDFTNYDKLWPRVSKFSDLCDQVVCWQKLIPEVTSLVSAMIQKLFPTEAQQLQAINSAWAKAKYDEKKVPKWCREER
jgi:hypothetical protein